MARMTDINTGRGHTLWLKTRDSMVWRESVGGSSVEEESVGGCSMDGESVCGCSVGGR